MASTGEPARLGVLIIVENLPVPFDRRVWNEARALRAAGYSVAVICPTGKGFEARQEVIDGIAIYRHPLPEASRAAAYLAEYGAALFWQIVLSLRAWRRMRFDVIHACNPPDTIFLVAAFWKVLFGTRFVFDQHDLCPELYEANFGRRGPLYCVLRGLERMTYRIADVVIATNRSYRRIALERGKVGPDRVFVVRSGPDLERMRIGPPQPALKNGRPFLVGYVGVIGKHEGIEYLLDAVAHIVHERGRRDIQFAVVGGGPELDRMRAAVERLGIGAFVSFPGRVPDEALLAWLNTADVCVNPDEVNDMNDKSTMNKIMEYMALAKPIVQFDVTEGRFSAQAASLYARPNDALSFAAAILELIDDPMERARMGAFGRERIERALAWTYEVPKLLAAYDAVAAKRRRRSSRRGRVLRELPATSSCARTAIAGSSRPALTSTGARSRAPCEEECQPSDPALVRNSGEGRIEQPEPAERPGACAALLDELETGMKKKADFDRAADEFLAPTPRLVRFFSSRRLLLRTDRALGAFGTGDARRIDG